jgi:hypothetical protein
MELLGGHCDSFVPFLPPRINVFLVFTFSSRLYSCSVSELMSCSSNHSLSEDMSFCKSVSE